MAALIPALINFQYIGDSRLLVVTDFHDAIVSDLRLAFRKDSEIRALFEHHLHGLRQSGTLRGLASHWVFKDRPEGDLSHRIFVQV